jgi:capsular exopolysaccharide synthesis family protein
VRNSASSILLIDGDLRRPTLHTLLGAPGTPGLSEYLEGKVDLMDILQRDHRPKPTHLAAANTFSNLTFIPAGICGDNSAELIANHRIEELINAVSPLFDWILIDSPPVLAVTDAVELAHAADAVLLIARVGSTTYPVAQSAQTAFTNSRILGFVLNDVKDPPSSGYGYYNHYVGHETGNLVK